MGFGSFDAAGRLPRAMASVAAVLALIGMDGTGGAALAGTPMAPAGDSPQGAARFVSGPAGGLGGAGPAVAGVASEDDLRCLTLAIAYEAGNQPRAGQEAVAEVVLNRTRHPAFPHSVCGVVFQGWTRRTGCQFTFTCDGALDRRLPVATLGAARAVAEAVVARAQAGTAPQRVGTALNYHATYVSPAWAARLDRVTQIGAHVFYRPAGGGQPEAGRWPARAEDEAEGAAAIGRYARYFDAVAVPAPSPAGPVARPGAAAGAGAVANGPFLPWGLSLR